jgi:hypothetical protein
MWSTLKRWTLISLCLGAAGVILFAGAFLQEFNNNELASRLPTLGLKLPLKDPRIEVSCFRFALELFDGDTLIKRYEAGFGRSTVAGRIGRDIASTPLGEYRIIKKEIREDVLARGSRFLLLDYPNSEDARRGLDANAITRDEYADIVSAETANQLPPKDTGLGGPLGIQGNFFFFRERHFTDGSVAISNGDINELFEYVPVGTPVIIKN